jgi:hypothetical protein
MNTGFGWRIEVCGRPARRLSACILAVSLAVAAGKAAAANAPATAQPRGPSIDKTDKNGPSAPAAADRTTVRCRIATGGIVLFDGLCERQTFGTKGSFNLSREHESGPIGEDVLFLTVAVAGKRRADVSAVTTGGHPSRWGPAKLSARTKGCWLGRDFRICTAEIR